MLAINLLPTLPYVFDILTANFNFMARVVVITKASFSFSFLAPKYWLTWFSVGVLYLFSWLPLKYKSALGKFLGRIVHRFLKKRRRIAEVNIALAFPELNKQQQADLVLKNLENTGIAIFESGMAWWWPMWRVRKHFGGIKGLEHIDTALADGKGILLLVPHIMHLEVTGTMMSQYHQGVSFYRPHNNPLMEYIIAKGRLRFSEALVTKRDVKSLLWAMNHNKLCYYLPDQDYGRNRSEFVPFFAVRRNLYHNRYSYFCSK